MSLISKADELSWCRNQAHCEGDDDDGDYDYAPAAAMDGDDDDDGGYDYAPAA